MLVETRTMALTIRQTKDYEAVKKLIKRIMPRDKLDLSQNICWLVKEGDFPVGFCTLKLLPRENAVFLSLSGVLPSHRGNGIQRRMIHVRCVWAANHGYDMALTYTLKDNHPSIASLIKSGFHFYHPENAWVGRDVHYFQKDLLK
jgi:GNAT superfamily N-acetyltransferase